MYGCSHFPGPEKYKNITKCHGFYFKLLYADTVPLKRQCCSYTSEMCPVWGLYSCLKGLALPAYQYNTVDSECFVVKISWLEIFAVFNFHGWWPLPHNRLMRKRRKGRSVNHPHKRINFKIFSRYVTLLSDDASQCMHNILIFSVHYNSNFYQKSGKGCIVEVYSTPAIMNIIICMVGSWQCDWSLHHVCTHEVINLLNTKAMLLTSN